MTFSEIPETNLIYNIDFTMIKKVLKPLQNTEYNICNFFKIRECGLYKPSQFSKNSNIISKVFILQRSLLFSFLFFIFSFAFVFAENTLEIEVDKNNITMKESFVLNIRMTTDQNISDGLKVAGLEDFQKFAQQTQDKISIVNGETQMMSEISLSFYPTRTGSFTIGPAIIQVGDDTIESNTVSIEISDVGKNGNSNSDIQDTQKDQKKEEIKENSREVMPEMKDDIYPPEKKFFDFKDFNFLFLMVLAIWLLCVFLLKHMSKKTVPENPRSDRASEQNREYISLIQSLQKLQEKASIMERSQFYSQLNTLFKKYFCILLKKDVLYCTYDEIKDLSLERKILEIFHMSYILEFSSQKEKNNIRKELMEQFLDIIQKASGTN